MKCIKTEDAVGLILCHDLTQIIKDVSKGPRFRKGHVVVKEDIPILLSMGKENLFVLEKDDNMLFEDEGAEKLVSLCLNENMEKSEAKEGKIEITSTIKGLLEVNTNALYKVNSTPEMMIATLPNNYPVEKGQKIAGCRVIPLLIAKEKFEALEAIKTPILAIHPFKLRTASIIVTGSEVKKGLIQDTFSAVVSDKLLEYGIETLDISYPGDDKATIINKIKDAKNKNSDLIICTGGMSVDPDDRTPLAIKESGAEIVNYGAPVLPGAMFLLSYLDNTPLVGLPGCVMYAKRTIFDLVLPLLAAKTNVTSKMLASLGSGGLCQNCEVCHYPNCTFGKGSFYD